MPGKLTLFTARVLLICALFESLPLPLQPAWAGPPNNPPIPTGATPPQTFPGPTEEELNSTYSGVPTLPVAPQVLHRPVVKDSFHCERIFLYKGQSYGCDSYVQRDAERLRVFVADDPGATSEIDTYQRNRKNVRTAAYVGSIGLLIALGGILASRGFQDSSGNIDSTGQSVRQISTITGFGLLGGAVIFGLVVLNNNESHLDRAVAIHNQNHPDDPIVLKFTTRFSL